MHDATQTRSANLLFVALLAGIAALGGLLFGYDTAVISGAVTAIQYNFVTPWHLGAGSAHWLSGFAVSIALLGCVLGAMAAGFLANRIGRKGSLILCSLLFIVSSLGAAYPEFFWNAFGAVGKWTILPFLVYRVLGGVAIGMASMLSPMYIAEIAPPERRGFFVTFQQIAIVLGINLVYIVNWKIQSFGDHTWLMTEGWRYMLASAACPALLLFVGMLALPDTPRYYVMRGRTSDALTLLQRTTRESGQDILRSIKESLVPKLGSHKILTPVVAIGVVLSALQQFVGINAVLYYAPVIFENMGSSTNSAFLQTVLVGLANTVFTAVAVFSVDKVGRKPLLIIGATLMGLSMFALGLLFTFQSLGIAALIAMLAYIGGFALSWGPVVWVVLSEMFPNAIRSRALALAVGVQWAANFLVTTIFPVIDQNDGLNAIFHHGFAYLAFAAICAVSIAFVWVTIPETKGVPLEDMEQHWKSRKATVSPDSSPAA